MPSPTESPTNEQTGRGRVWRRRSLAAAAVAAAILMGAGAVAASSTTSPSTAQTRAIQPGIEQVDERSTTGSAFTERTATSCPHEPDTTRTTEQETRQT